ncbi:MAG TPA: TetR family transcriptional regulator [Steroidobacteraceae bacterium]|nr:TetR family transcriptional regulator [Steroidobacteraceae bacterium]
MALAARSLPPARKRRTQEERTATARAKLMEAAIELICEKGFARTTMSDIAAAADFTRGAIHHHFQNRVDLVRTIINDVERRVIESFSAATQKPNVSLAQRIDILLDGLYDVSQSPAYVAAIDIWFTSRAEPKLRDAALLSVRRYSNHFRAAWQQTFGDEIPEKTIAECRQVVVAVSRGLVISSLFATEQQVAAETFATVRAMIKRHMLAAIKKGR